MTSTGGDAGLATAHVFVRRDFFPSNYNYTFVRRFDGATSLARAEGQPVTLLAEDAVGFISPFALEKREDPIEREGELLRRELAPDRCSRLGGVFVFADSQSCLRAASLYGWNLSTVRRGRAFGAWHALDMQIISLLRASGVPEELRRTLWEHYWSGEPGTKHDSWRGLLEKSPLHREPLWEWLVDGYVVFEPDDVSPFD